jgi:hypothetical protein
MFLMLGVLLLLLLSSAAEQRASADKIVEKAETEAMEVAALPRMCPLQLEVEAHLILETEFRSILKPTGLKLPLECPFHADHDRYTHARMSRAVRRGNYRCAFCSEEYTAIEQLEAHMQSRHASKISNANTKCYSDYCPMLGCASSEEERRKNPMNDAALALNMHKCKDVLSSCFERHSAQGREMRSIFTTKFCSRFSKENADAYTGSNDAMLVLKYVGFAFLVMGMIIFYILLWLWRSESVTSRDLPTSGILVRLKRLFINSQKKKGY